MVLNCSKITLYINYMKFKTFTDVYGINDGCHRDWLVNSFDFLI